MIGGHRNYHCNCIPKKLGHLAFSANIQETERKEAVPSLVNPDDMPNPRQVVQEVESKHQCRRSLPRGSKKDKKKDTIFNGYICQYSFFLHLQSCIAILFCVEVAFHLEMPISVLQKAFSLES